MTKSMNRYFLSVFALAALLFVAACGSAAAPDPGNTTGTSNSTPEQSAAVSTGDTKGTEMDQPKDQGATPAEGTMDGTTQRSAQVATEGTTKGTTERTTGGTTGGTTGSTAAGTGEGTTAGDSAAGAAAETPPTKNISHLSAGGDIGDRAAEIEGITAWINSDPLTIAELRGKVVLVDFWTYTCINCIRTLPFLKLWNSRYADDGLVIIGVHSPEFEFEKNFDNVTKATIDKGVVWPVALDNDFATWQNYSNRYWPAKYLIDKDGVVQYSHFGEGRYAETEEKIRELLEEAGASVLEDEFAPALDQKLDPTYLGSPDAELTREVYAGYRRNLPDRLYGGGGYVGQENYYKAPEEVVTFALPGELTPHVLYFHGRWRVGPENIDHGRITQGYEDSINLVFSARSVNAVLTSGSGEPYRVRVTVDGNYLTEANKGEDVRIGNDGESYILVNEPRMYNVFENPEWVWRNTLQMSSESEDFGLFAFTFGVYEKQT